MFWKRNKTNKEFTPEWIIVGLGNPGIQYEITRHNAGFLCIDALAKDLGIEFSKKRFDSLVAHGNIDGTECLLMKPQTYMNSSGKAVIEAVKKYGIPAERVLVIADDICFNVGSLRIRRNGSSGGQKGVNDIIEALETQNFPRIKIGVGKRPDDVSTVDWVLGNFSDEDLKSLESVIEAACLAVKETVAYNIDNAMGKYNKTV